MAKTGVELIQEERTRQIEVEGWKDDSGWRKGELADAASSYIDAFYAGSPIPDKWPWIDGWWKPSQDRVRNLVKAGALIAAEIDRLNNTK